MWLQASKEAHSYRRIYALALDIASSDAASHRLRKAARSVVRSLDDVIDLVIADANVLARARKRFVKMTAVMQESGESEKNIAA